MVSRALQLIKQQAYQDNLQPVPCLCVPDSGGQHRRQLVQVFKAQQQQHGDKGSLLHSIAHDAFHHEGYLGHSCHLPKAQGQGKTKSMLVGRVTMMPTPQGLMGQIIRIGQGLCFDLPHRQPVGRLWLSAEPAFNGGFQIPPSKGLPTALLSVCKSQEEHCLPHNLHSRNNGMF